MDLDDHHNNFYAGIHAANMAGTWQAIVNGFAGVRCQQSMLRFKPWLPDNWDEYSFKICFRGNLLKVNVTKGQAEFLLEEGEGICFYIGKKEAVIEEKGGRYIEKI